MFSIVELESIKVALKNFNTEECSEIKRLEKKCELYIEQMKRQDKFNEESADYQKRMLALNKTESNTSENEK